MDLLSRFNAKFKVCPDTGCWLWTGGRNDSGYAYIRVDGRQTRAHRWSYERFRGPIPAGLILDHLCRVRHCVNPKHLEAVSHQENSLRGETMAAMRAAKTHCPQGHPYSGDNLYISPKNERYCKACRRETARRCRARKKAA